jgi:hypothetical protein
MDSSCFLGYAVLPQCTPVFVCLVYLLPPRSRPSLLIQGGRADELTLATQGDSEFLLSLNGSTMYNVTSDVTRQLLLMNLASEAPYSESSSVFNPSEDEGEDNKTEEGGVDVVHGSRRRRRRRGSGGRGRGWGRGRGS